MPDEAKKDTAENPNAPSFGEALEELEEILSRLENEEIDIDALAEELRRGTALLDLCRGKIRKAEVEVTQIVQRLDATDQEREEEPE